MNKKTFVIDARKFSDLNGAFTFQDTFIHSHDFTIPKCTTVFIAFDQFDNFDGDIDFEWQLFEETRGKLMMKSNIQETLKYLDFDIISTSMFIVNLIHPVAAIFPTVAEAVKKLSVAYNIHVFNILFEVNELENMIF